MEIPPGSIVITADQMYKEMQATHAAVTKVGSDLGEIKKELGKVLPDHEARIRSLERWRWISAGVALALGGAGGAGLQAMLGG